MKSVLVAILVLLAVESVWGQDEPSFRFLGDAEQTILASAPSWTVAATPVWGLALNVKPTWSQGTVAFLADGSFLLPLTSSLAPGAPGVLLYEAYARWTPLPGLDVTLGKKRLNIGVGQTFSVGDSLNPSVSFFDQKTGFRGLTVAWAPNAWLGWSAGLSLDRNLGADRWNPATEVVAGPTSVSATEWAWASQVEVLVEKFQGTASLVYSPDRTFNPSLGASYDWSGWLVSGEFAAEFLPQGVVPSSEPLSAWTSPTPWIQPAPSGSLGVRRTWSLWGLDVTASVQYLYWGQGWTDTQINAWRDARGPSTSGSPQALLLDGMRQSLPLRDHHNAFFRLDLAQDSAFDLSGLWIADLQDGSSVSEVSLTMLPWDSFDLVGSFEAASGGILDAWSSVPLPPWVAPSVTGTGVQFLASFQTRYHF
jgi:hypothetical protein